MSGILLTLFSKEGLLGSHSSVTAITLVLVYNLVYIERYKASAGVNICHVQASIVSTSERGHRPIIATNFTIWDRWQVRPTLHVEIVST